MGSRYTDRAQVVIYFLKQLMHMYDRELQNHWLPAECAYIVVIPPVPSAPTPDDLAWKEMSFNFHPLFFFFFDRHASYQCCVGNWEDVLTIPTSASFFVYFLSFFLPFLFLLRFKVGEAH